MDSPPDERRRDAAAGRRVSQSLARLRGGARLAAAGGASEPDLASDGVWDEPGQWFIIWPLEEVARRNLRANQVEGAARSLWIGFGDEGTGDPFCVDRLGGTAVYHWSSIDRAATPMASDLAEFWTALVAGLLPPH